MREAFASDAIGTICSSITGTSPVTSYIESGSGIAAGGKTGITALSTAVFFVLALFLSPLFLLVPSAATAPALIVVGYLMMLGISGIDFKNMEIGIPAFITIFMTVFAYSITEGIIWGILAYTIVKIFKRDFKSISVGNWVLFGIFVLRFFFMY